MAPREGKTVGWVAQSPWAEASPGLGTQASTSTYELCSFSFLSFRRSFIFWFFPVTEEKEKE